MYFISAYCVSRVSYITQSFLESLNKLERREDGERETEKEKINWWIKFEESSAISVERNMYIGRRS